MGRTAPSQGLAPPSFRRDARAKKAKATLNKVIPALLSAHPRAKRGAEASELVVDLPAHKKSQKPTTGGKNGYSSAQAASTPSPRLQLQVADTLTAAHSLLRDETTGKVDISNKEARVAILNMASPLSPGGGFVNGASSQEESLCMRTTLLSSLKDEFYRLPEIGAVYTPDVLIFRDEAGEDLEKRDRWFVDCVSAAMLRMPETDVDEETGRESYVNAADRDLVLQKMRMVMRICQAKGVKKIVLGAWGCGAYGNPVCEVGSAWNKVLLGGKNRGKAKQEIWDGIEEVVFAIKDRSLADRFEQAFGPGLTRAEVDEQSSDGEEDDAETMRMKELQEKIQELETRMEQTKSDQVKTGLSSILTGLKTQLGDGKDGSLNETDDQSKDGTISDEDQETEDETDESSEDDGIQRRL